MGIFKLENEKSCFKCNKVFLKSKGSFLNEKWFCSSQCEPKLQEIYENWKRKNPKMSLKTNQNADLRKKAGTSKEKEIEFDLGINDYEEKETKIRTLESFE